MAATHEVSAGPGHHFVDQDTQTPETTIAVGDSVRWTAPGSEHTIVSDNVAPFATLNPPLNGDVQEGSDAYVRRFDAAGDYGYHCDIHGGDPVSKTGMYGIIHVQRTGASS